MTGLEPPRLIRHVASVEAALDHPGLSPPTVKHVKQSWWRTGQAGEFRELCRLRWGLPGHGSAPPRTSVPSEAAVFVATPQLAPAHVARSRSSLYSTWATTEFPPLLPRRV